MSVIMELSNKGDLFITEHSIGKAISELRKAKGWTQVELAERLNVSDMTYFIANRGASGAPFVFSFFLFRRIVKTLGHGRYIFRSCRDFFYRCRNLFNGSRSFCGRGGFFCGRSRLFGKLCFCLFGFHLVHFFPYLFKARHGIGVRGGKQGEEA